MSNLRLCLPLQKVRGDKIKWEEEDVDKLFRYVPGWTIDLVLSMYAQNVCMHNICMFDRMGSGTGR